MRLTGLPSVERYPEATVTRHTQFIAVVFGGNSGEQTIRVPLKYIGGDAQSAELWLLADLKRMGYETRRDTQ